MNHAQLLDRLANELKPHGVTKQQVTAMVEAFVHEVVEAVAHGEQVKVSGLGTFYPKDKKSKNRQYSPAIGWYEAGPRRMPRFRPMPVFRERSQQVATELGDL